MSAWRMFVLLLIGLGLLVGRRQSALIPWLLFAFSKTAVTLAFFGYAREGAVLTPVVALLVGLAVVWIVGAMPIFARSPRRWLTVCLGVVLVLATVETARWLSEPLITLDGVRLGSYDPFPATDYKVRMMEVH